LGGGEKIYNLGDSCMNFKRNALRTVVAAAGLAGAVTASAGTWAPAGAGAPVFATELFGATTPDITPAAAVYTMANVIASSSQASITYTLTGGTWGGTGLSSSSLAYLSIAGAGVATTALVDGGANTDSTATFRVTVAITTTSTDTFTLTYGITGATGMATASTTNGPTLAFSIVDTLGSVDTSGAAGVVAASAAGVTAAGAANASPSLIDVTNSSTQFTGASTLSYNAGTFNITDSGAGVESDGVTAFTLNASEGAVTAASTIATVTGDFSASIGTDTDVDGNTSEGEGVTLTACTLAANATTLTATTATFVLAGADVATQAGNTTDCVVNINVDGTTVIPEQSPSLTLAIDYAAANAVDEALTVALAPIAKDGSTTAVNLLLNPTGAYDNFIRVSNTTSVAGDVFITVYNDSGDAATYTLVTALGAQASTDLISVDTIYASAQTADATFDVGTGKLRASVTGEFGGLSVQNISTSTDGTTFFTF
jgi:hypothetical protein